MTENAEQILAELVACKDLHDEAERWPLNSAGRNSALAEYQRRQPAAWAAARAHLAAVPSALPDSMVQEPTVEMLRAGMDAQVKWANENGEKFGYEIYRAMLAAAPKGQS